MMVKKHGRGRPRTYKTKAEAAVAKALSTQRSFERSFHPADFRGNERKKSRRLYSQFIHLVEARLQRRGYERQFRGLRENTPCKDPRAPTTAAAEEEAEEDIAQPEPPDSSTISIEDHTQLDTNVLYRDIEYAKRDLHTCVEELRNSAIQFMSENMDNKPSLHYLPLYPIL